MNKGVLLIAVNQIKSAVDSCWFQWN